MLEVPEGSSVEPCLSWERATLTVVGQGLSPEALGSPAGYSQQDILSCRPWGSVCLLWD